ncbi:MAG: hypothetical protein KatS3mg108_1396 [Isosphaeraceae bacterium]|jgi:hypothetical protein|nr:MAG: hypothetical protein KatS3mg108_1396 [Isosphaeraceae bacterium]
MVVPGLGLLLHRLVAVLAVGLAGHDPLPEGSVGLARRYPGDAGIAGDPAVLFHEDFESDDPLSRWDAAYHAHTTHLVADPARVHRGRRSLEFRVPRQRAELSNALVKRLGAGHDRVFLRFYSRYDDAFDQVGSSHNGGYLAAIAPGLPVATPGLRSNGRNKFAVSYESWRGESDTPSPGRLNVYIYHPGQRSDYGDHFFPSGTVLPFSAIAGPFGPDFVPRPDVTPPLGRWACYELMVQANRPGHHDGRVACWLDGELIADFTGLHLRDLDSLKINHVEINLHIKTNPTRENRKAYDDIVIATEYVGPIVEP